LQLIGLSKRVLIPSEAPAIVPEVISFHSRRPSPACRRAPRTEIMHKQRTEEYPDIAQWMALIHQIIHAWMSTSPGDTRAFPNGFVTAGSEPKHLIRDD
jgi:hypothetical protein